MKPLLVRSLRWMLPLAVAAVAAIPGEAQQPVVGYVNKSLDNGYHFLTNPLKNGSTNNIRDVIPYPPDGTRVWFWNHTNQVFDPPSTFSTGVGWDVVLLLDVGRGFVLHTTTTFTNTFVGEVLQGSLTNFIAGTNRFTLVGSKVPQSSDLSGLAFPPSEGDVVYQFPSFLQRYLDGFGYLSGHGWHDPAGSAGVNGPTVVVGDSFFVQHPGPAKNWVRNFTVLRPVEPLPDPLPPSPEITDISIKNGNVTLRINKATRRYNVQFSTDRVNWTTIAIDQTGAVWRSPLPDGLLGFFQVVQP